MGILQKSQNHFYSKTENERRGCVTSFVLAFIFIVVLLCCGCAEEPPQPIECNCGSAGLSFESEQRFYVMAENECSETLQLIELDSTQFADVRPGDVICTDEQW